MIQIARPGSGVLLPESSEVESLYAAAAAGPPLNEDPSWARVYAGVYEWAQSQACVTAAWLRAEKKLIAFAYGHRWNWAEQDYPWAHDLRERLGPEAARIEGSLTLALLARSPAVHGQGLGEQVLKSWLHAIGNETVWLQTQDKASPATRLYEAMGFEHLGFGPDTANGCPGLVLIRECS